MRSTLRPLAVALALAAAGCGGGTLNGVSTTSSTAAQPQATSTSSPTTTATTPTTAGTPSTTTPARPGSTPATTPAPRTTPGAPNAAFAARANGVCQREDRALAAKLKQHPQAATGGNVRAAAQLLIPAEQARIAALQALPAPASVSARYGQFIAAMQTRLAQLQRLAGSTPGKPLPRSSVLTLQGSTQRVMQLGASLGLNCAG